MNSFSDDMPLKRCQHSLAVKYRYSFQSIVPRTVYNHKSEQDAQDGKFVSLNFIFICICEWFGFVDTLVYFTMLCNILQYKYFHELSYQKYITQSFFICINRRRLYHLSDLRLFAVYVYQYVILLNRYIGSQHAPKNILFLQHFFLILRNRERKKIVGLQHFSFSFNF